MKTTPLHNAISNLRAAATTALEKLPTHSDLDKLFASIPSREDLTALAMIVKELDGPATIMGIIRGDADYRVKLADVPEHDINRCCHEAKDAIIASLRSAQVSDKEHGNSKLASCEATIRQKDDTIRSVTRMKLQAQDERDQAKLAMANLSRELVNERSELENVRVALAALLTTIGGPSTQDLIADAKSAIHRVKHTNVTVEALRNEIINDREKMQAGGVTDVMRTMVLAELRERLALTGDDEGRIGPDDVLDDLIAVRNAAPITTEQAQNGFDTDLI